MPPNHFLKPDNFYRRIYKPKLERKLKSNVEAIFNKQYDTITKTELHVFVENIIERLYLLKKYLPRRLNYVLKGVLIHPNVSPLDKNVIINCELYSYKIESTKRFEYTTNKY